MYIFIIIYIIFFYFFIIIIIIIIIGSRGMLTYKKTKLLVPQITHFGVCTVIFREL